MTSKDIVPVSGGDISSEELKAMVAGTSVAAIPKPDNQADNKVTQIGNIVSGGQAGRDLINVNLPKKPAGAVYMQRLISDYMTEIAGNATLRETIQKLEHFISQSTSDLRDLETKLVAGGRANQVAEALELKENAAKRLMVHQTSKTAQLILATILAEMTMRFSQDVHSHILAGVDRTEIDARVRKSVLEGAMELLAENPLDLNSEDLRSFLFLLTGNCHIKWD